MTQSLYYEDWVIGQVYETQPRVVTEADVEHFGEIEQYRGPLHNDPEAAKASIFREMTVHGVLPIAMAFGMMGAMGLYDASALAFLGMSWKYHSPVRVGDSLRVRWSVRERRPTSKPGRGVIVRDVQVLNQDQTQVCSGDITSLWAFRPQNPA